MEILEIRLIWVMCIFIGMFLVLFGFIFYAKHRQLNDNPLHKNYFIAVMIFVVSILIFGKDIVPEKYDVEYKKVYQCGYVDVLVPKYPDGIVK